MVTLTPPRGLDRDQAEWQQLAPLYPALKSGLQVSQHIYRGATWFLLTDPSSGQHFRCTGEAYRFLMRLDGRRTVADVLDETLTDETGRLSAQAEIMQLFVALHASNLLKGSAFHSANVTPQGSKVSSILSRILLRPLAIRFPLIDPDKFLTRLLFFVRPVFSKWVFLVWMTIVFWAASLAVFNWPELTIHWNARFKDPQNLLTVLLLYPLIKAFHELGHGFATKVWDGEVHEMGIMLLVFAPVPYVDASASNAFSRKHQRMLVSGAGIMVELCIASIAMLFWAKLSPGLARDLCFNAAFIGGVSTLLFNGNPLLRYDGYYVLSDLVEIPNMGTRSTQYLGYLIRRYLFGLTATRSPVTAPGERGWLFTYGILAGIYRFFISLVIALLVAGEFFVFGVILALWFVVLQILWPMARSVYRLVPEVITHGVWLRAIAIVFTFCTLVTGLLFVKSFEYSSYAEGLVVLPEDATVRTGVDGFITSAMAKDGQWVHPGDLLFRLDNPEIRTQSRIVQAKQAELRVKYSQSLNEDRLRAEILKIELQALQAEFDELQGQLNDLEITGSTAGWFTIPRSVDLTDRYVKKGDVLGYVVDMSRAEAMVVITQDQLDRIRRSTRNIEIRLVSEPSRLLQGQLMHAVPQAIRQLPNQILGSRGGGRIPVDARDPAGLTTIEPVFELNLDLPARSEGLYLGCRLMVRFVHVREPLAGRLYAYLRGQLLKRFNF